ncbi:MAG: hypothetical protein HKN13_06460, partial [Rhodothermales bacterium]|nr:hypothetical protein [Rhodothermales bacterium]
MSTPSTRALILGFALFSYICVPSTNAQDGEDSPVVFLEVSCMKSLNDDYRDVETEIWQPMHQAMVDAGQKMGWAFYWVMYGDRSMCDHYTVNLYRGADQLDANVNYRDVFESVHPDKNVDEAMARTSASREMVRSELWRMVDGKLPTDFTYAHVARLNVTDGREYTKMENEIFTPLRNARVDEGLHQGWARYRLVSPTGDAVPYNTGSVIFTNESLIQWGQG